MFWRVTVGQIKENTKGYNDESNIAEVQMEIYPSMMENKGLMGGLSVWVPPGAPVSPKIIETMYWVSAADHIH